MRLSSVFWLSQGMCVNNVVSRVQLDVLCPLSCKSGLNRLLALSLALHVKVSGELHLQGDLM